MWAGCRRILQLWPFVGAKHFVNGENVFHYPVRAHALRRHPLRGHGDPIARVPQANDWIQSFGPNRSIGRVTTVSAAFNTTWRALSNSSTATPIGVETKGRDVLECASQVVDDVLAVLHTIKEIANTPRIAIQQHSNRIASVTVEKTSGDRSEDKQAE